LSQITDDKRTSIEGCEPMNEGNFGASHSAANDTGACTVTAPRSDPPNNPTVESASCSKARRTGGR
jgi:hypothetical protein